MNEQGLSLGDYQVGYWLHSHSGHLDTLHAIQFDRTESHNLDQAWRLLCVIAPQLAVRR